MNYKIVFTRRAAKDISKLEPGIKEKIGDALKRYSKDPLNYARKMVDPSLGNYRFRIGDRNVTPAKAGVYEEAHDPKGSHYKIRR
jgi:mRNA interferase RelE/StbE